MNIAQMIRILEIYIDDVAVADEAIQLFNIGKDRMATAIKAKFPDLSTSLVDPSLTEEFAFDSKYHEIPVLYAAAMYKSADSAISEKNNYMTQFLNGLDDFTENYDVPPQYWDRRNVQQFTATESQTDFTVTKEGYSPKYGRLRVFVDGTPTSVLETNATGFTIEPVSTGSIVTAEWDENYIFDNPPYPWQGSW